MGPVAILPFGAATRRGMPRTTLISMGNDKAWGRHTHRCNGGRGDGRGDRNGYRRENGTSCQGSSTGRRVLVGLEVVEAGNSDTRGGKRGGLHNRGRCWRSGRGGRGGGRIFHGRSTCTDRNRSIGGKLAFARGRGRRGRSTGGGRAQQR